MRTAPVLNLLAVDTSTRSVGLALYNGTQVMGELTWTSLDYHSVELAPAVADLLAKCQVKASELAALAVAIGPGSFTGLRIGMAFVKGLALARRLPLVGIPTLDILAAGQPVLDIPMAAVLQAGRGRLAVGWYQASSGAWQASAQNEVLTPEDLSERILNPTFVCGELTEDERHLLARKRKNIILASPANNLRRPAYLAELGFQRWQAGLADNPASLAPIYLHYNEPIPG